MASAKSRNINSTQLDDLLLSASALKATVDNKTILNTPIPISTSTLRQPLQENSLNLSDNSSLKVSQLASSTVSNMSADRSLPLRNFVTDENQPQEISACEIHGSVDSMSISRTSWGLVPEEYMAELSNDELLPSMSSRVACFAASQTDMRTIDLAESRGLSISSSSSVITPRASAVSEAVHKNQTARVESSTVSTSNAWPQSHQGGRSAGPAGAIQSSKSPSFSVKGGVMAVLSAMMGSGGTGQGDSEFEDSVHEVVLNESDIRQFDDEFSDLETTADFEEEELRCEGDEFSSSHWNFLEEKFPQLTDQRLEPINEEPNGSQLFDYDSSEIAEYERQDRLASLYFCPTSSLVNYAEGEDNLAEDSHRTSDTALAFQLSGSSDSFQMSLEDKQHFEAEEIETARQDPIQSEILMGDGDAGSQGYQSLFQIIQQHITRNSLSQSCDILQPSDTSESSLIDVTLLRSSDGNADASDVTVKDVSSEGPWNDIDTREENEENPELFKIRFSEVLDLAGGDGLLTLGKFSDTMKEQRKSGQEEAFPRKSGQEEAFPVSTNNKQTSNNDNSPVYVNEEGEWVTYLAYSHPLENPFEDSHMEFGEGDNLGSFSNHKGIYPGEVFGNEDEFKSGESCLDMLDIAEKKFEEENMFIQDAVVVPSNTASDTRDSWSFQSHLSHLYDTSDQVEEMEPYMRISIGAFIGMRTEALGSLDGSTDNRPTFGTKFTTPPANRKPVALLDGNVSASGVAQEEVAEEAIKSAVTNMSGAASVCSDGDDTLTASALDSLSESSSMKPMSRGQSNGNQTTAYELSSSISQSLSFSELSSITSASENHVATVPSSVKANPMSSGLTKSLITHSGTSLSESSYDASLSKSVNKSKPDVTNSAALTNSQPLATSKLPALLAPAETKRSSFMKTEAFVGDTKPGLSSLSKTAVSNTLSNLDASIKHAKAENDKASVSKASSNLDTSLRNRNAETMKPVTSKMLPGSEFGRKLGSLESLKTASTKCSLPTESKKSLDLDSCCKPDSSLQDKQGFILGSSVCSTKAGSGVGSLKTGSTLSSDKKSIPVSASRTKKLQDSKISASETSSEKTRPSLSRETQRSSATFEQLPKTDRASKGQAYSKSTQSLSIQRTKMTGIQPDINAIENSSVENMTDFTSGNKLNSNSICTSVPVKAYPSNDVLETNELDDSSQITNSRLSCSTLEMVSKSRHPSNKVPSSGHLKSGTILTEVEVQDAGSNPLHPAVESKGCVGDKEEVATEGRRSVDSRQKSLEGSWNASGETSQSSALEQTTVLNITDIARKISMSSESENPEDLAKLIAVISNSKWNGKNLPGHGARNEFSPDLSKSEKLEVTKAALLSNVVNSNDDREKVVHGETNAAKIDVLSEMTKNKTDAMNAVGLSSTRIGPNSCAKNSEAPSSKENTFKLPEVSLVKKQKPPVIQEKVKKPRVEENFNFRSPRPSSCFSRSKRQELEQSVLVNSYAATEVSFCNNRSMVNETNQPTDRFTNAAGNVVFPPIDPWSCVDISANLGQTVKLAPSVIKLVVPTSDAGDAKQNSMSKVARSFSFQQAVAAGHIFNKSNSRTELNVASSGSATEAENHTVAADGSEQRKDKSKSAVDISLSAVPSQSSQPQNSGALVPQCESFVSTKTSALNAAGAMSARLSTGLMSDSIFDASRMLPIPEDENVSQLSQYPATKPSLRYATNVSLMTSALSVCGIDNSLAIDPFSQSTPMVKTSVQPNMYEPMYNIPGYQGGMNQMMAKQRMDPVHLGVPSELSFQEVCCVGLTVNDTLRVTNHSPYWVHTHFCLVSLSVDGQMLDPFSVLPFVVKQRLMLQPFGSEDVKISFAPRHPGSYVAQLTLLVDQPQHASNIPSAITLRAVAEKPCIQIITPVAELHLDFGALPWGSHKVMPLTLVNKGRAMVPVRLFISSPKSSSCCFSFAYYDGDLTNANMNVSAQCNCMLQGIDANAKEFPVSLMVVFRAPNQQSARGLIPVQEALGFITLEIDLPAVIIPLGSVRLKGLSGTARLHAPEQMDMLILKADVGTGPQMQVVPLRNAGNIPLDVSLEMAHWTDLFNVTPMQVMIEPGGQSEVCVRFEPTSAAVKGAKFESLLFMIIEPDGPAYEIPVLGEIVSKVSSRELSKLLSNRSFVAWGGVPVGKTGNQLVTLKNNSNKLLKLLLEIQGSPEFKFVMNYGRKEKTTTSWEIVVKSSEEFPINLAFTPTRVRGSSAKLHIRHAGTSIKYSIPLSGYGGQSQVILDNIPLQPEGYYLSTASYDGIRKAVVVVTMSNIGTRPAFINGQSFQDLTCSVAQTPGKVIIEPNEFCLPVNEKQDVAIIIQLSDKDLSCWEKSPASFVTVLSFYYGDEISRQLYQRSLNRGNRPSQEFILASNNPLRKIRFDVHYRNEELINEGQEICETADDISLFYKNMTKVTLAVGLSSRGQSAGHLRPLIPDTASGFAVSAVAMQRQISSPSQALELSADERALPRSDSPPVRDPSHSTVPAVSKRSVTFEERLEVIEPPAKRGLEPLTSDSAWKIEPEELCIAYASGDQRPEIKHISIVNSKDSTIKFDISWPAHCLCITPEHGTVSPKSSLQLCVCISNRLKDKEIVLPWNGMLHITCEGEVKVVRVQVLEVTAKCNMASGVKTVQVCAVSAVESLRLGDQHMVVTITYPSVLEGESSHGQMVKQSLHFPTTPVGQAQDLPLDIVNASIHRVSWVVSGFTPPYLKPIAHAQRTDEDQFRILYTVYSMHQSMGTLEPGQKTRVGVRFRPRQAGTYSQHYDVKFERLDVHEESYTCKLELYGKSTKNESLGISNSTLGLQGISAVTVSKVSSLSSNSVASDVSKDSSSGSKSSEGWLISRPKAVEFPKSSNLEPCMQKVELKNASSVEHKIDILSPVLPFVVKHSQVVIKSRHFLRLPVEFRPTKPGRYHSVLVLKADTGETFMIQLWAESA